MGDLTVAQPGREPSWSVRQLPGPDRGAGGRFAHAQKCGPSGLRSQTHLCVRRWETARGTVLLVCSGQSLREFQPRVGVLLRQDGNCLCAVTLRSGRKRKKQVRGGACQAERSGHPDRHECTVTGLSVAPLEVRIRFGGATAYIAFPSRRCRVRSDRWRLLTATTSRAHPRRAVPPSDCGSAF